MKWSQNVFVHLESRQRVSSFEKYCCHLQLLISLNGNNPYIKFTTGYIYDKNIHQGHLLCSVEAKRSVGFLHNIPKMLLHLTSSLFPESPNSMPPLRTSSQLLP